MATTIHLMRHGEVHNPHGILYGRLPGYRLSERGEAMARRVAEHLAESGPARHLVAVVASPLERAQQTAEPIAAAFGLEVRTDDRLVEADNHFQGLTFGVGDGSLRHLRHWPRMWNPWRPSWGEPYRQQTARMLAAVADARQLATQSGSTPDAEVLLVSHQLPIWVTRLALERRPFLHDPRKRQCSLASLTSLRFDGDRFLGIDYSEPAADLLPGASHVAGA